MAEKKEQLRIEGELDTSKLKSGAKQGFDAISKEEKRVQQESRQTSKALDDIGNAGKNAGRAMQQAGQQSTSALKNIGNEAKNTVTQIDNIAKATKQIKFQQALGVANHAVSQLAPVGQALGQAAGMSDSQINLAGAGISGAMSGAMAGAALGPWGAAAGALMGAATSLLTAGRELQKAAMDKKAESERTQSAIRDSIGLQDLQEKAKKMSRTELLGEVERMKGVKAQRESGLRELAFSEVTPKNAERIQSEINETVDLIGRANKVLAIYEEALRKSNEVKVGNDTGAWADDFMEVATSGFFADTKKWQTELANKPKPTNYDVGVWGQDFMGAATSDFFNDTKKWQTELARNKEKKISTSEGMLKYIEQIGGAKLSDSLTRVGGGTGYGTQMNGIASKVNTITDTLKSILSELKGIKQDESSETVFTN